MLLELLSGKELKEAVTNYLESKHWSVRIGSDLKDTYAPPMLKVAIQDDLQLLGIKTKVIPFINNIVFVASHKFKTEDYDKMLMYAQTLYYKYHIYVLLVNGDRKERLESSINNLLKIIDFDSYKYNDGMFIYE